MASRQMEIDEFKAKTADAVADAKRVLGKIDPDNPFEMNKCLITLQEKIDFLNAYQKALQSLI